MGGIIEKKLEMCKDGSSFFDRKYWTIGILGTKEKSGILACSSGSILQYSIIILSEDKKVMEELKENKSNLKSFDVINYDDACNDYFRSSAYVISSIEEYDKI